MYFAWKLFPSLGRKKTKACPHNEGFRHFKANKQKKKRRHINPDPIHKKKKSAEFHFVTPFRVLQVPDGLSRHRSIHLQTLTDHRGCDEPGLPAGTARWPSYVFGLGDLPFFAIDPHPTWDVMGSFLAARKSFNMFFCFGEPWNCLCRNSTPLDYQFRNLSILRCGKLPDVLHLFSHKMDLNNVQTLHLAGILRSNIFHQLQVGSRCIRSFSLKNVW